MARPAKITTSFPSVRETAKLLGVSKRDAKVLSELAERSQKTGLFVIPGLTRKERRAKTAVKFRSAKTAKDAIGPSKTK